MKGDILGMVIGLGVLLLGAAVWSLLVPMWLIVVAGIALVLWMISINNAERRRFSDQAEQRRRNRKPPGRTRS